MVETDPPCPPPSVPCATMMSAPFATASFAIADALHLADQKRAGALDAVRMRRRIAEGQHDGRGLALQREIEKTRLPRHAPCNKADADARFARGIELLLEPGFVAIAAAENAEAAGRAHRRGELSIRDKVHRGEQHRMANVELS